MGRETVDGGTEGWSADSDEREELRSDIDGLADGDSGVVSELWAMDVWNVSSRRCPASCCCCRGSTLSDAPLAEAEKDRMGKLDLDRRELSL